ncbi:MAG: hypothetical protein RLZZ340_226 [Actinomycetota bacterium]|jgi:hypothetical protein
MIKTIVPVVPVSKIEPTLELLAKVGFKHNWTHDPNGAGLRYASASDEAGNELHLSESRGDGTGPVVVYFWTDAVDVLAEQAGTTAEDQTWHTREFWLKDTDGNSFRFGQRLD